MASIFKVAGFLRVTAKETGRAGFDPAGLLKLYVYGDINLVRRTGGGNLRPIVTSR